MCCMCVAGVYVQQGSPLQGRPWFQKERKKRGGGRSRAHRLVWAPHVGVNPYRGGAWCVDGVRQGTRQWEWYEGRRGTRTPT